MYAYTMPDNVPVPHLPAQSVFLSERSNKVYNESALRYIREYKLGTIIGEPTYGFGGSLNYMTLPGGIVVYVNAMFTKNEKGILSVDKGIQPDIEVWPTLQGIRAGRDEILERAIQYATAVK